MKVAMKNIIIMLSAWVCTNAIFAASTINSPIGEWKTIDDLTNQPAAIVKITEDQQHDFSGRIIKIFPSKGHDEKELCDACQGDKHLQPIVGMVILYNISQQGPNLWGGGKVLDPKNGKTYEATLQLSNEGQLLNLRGYIGIPLLGRTQNWQRVK